MKRCRIGILFGSNDAGRCKPYEVDAWDLTYSPKAEAVRWAAHRAPLRIGADGELEEAPGSPRSRFWAWRIVHVPTGRAFPIGADRLEDAGLIVRALERAFPDVEWWTSNHRELERAVKRVDPDGLRFGEVARAARAGRVELDRLLETLERSGPRAPFPVDPPVSRLEGFIVAEYGSIEEAGKAALFGAGSPGICRACGATREGCEPDARNYPCDACGMLEVLGLEEALMHVASSIGRAL